MDDVGQGTVALDVPADFLSTTKLAGSEEGAGELGFGEACVGDGAGEDLAGLGGGLVDGVGEGAGANDLEVVLGSEERALVRLDLGDLLAGQVEVLPDLKDGLEDEGTDPKEATEQEEDSADGGGEDLFALVHEPPPRFMGSGSSEPSSAGRVGTFSLVRSIFSFAGMRSSTTEAKS